MGSGGARRGVGGKRKRPADSNGQAQGAVGNEDEADLDDGNFLSLDIGSKDFRRGISEEFQKAEPYRHCVLNRVVNQGRLKKVRNEIIHNLKATYKETDIYKVLQTGDLANLDGLPEDEQEKLRHLRELKDAIYSEEFRAFVQDITGCGELVEKTDCSCNIYAQGGHLLCHDDVIGTRRVSYIIYLTDPENEWRSEDGGALALYDCIDNPEEKGKKLPLPQSHPLKRILPLWNTMVMFAVLPGKSFHDIEEVVTSDNPRLSISGWFHGKTPPEGSEKATLNQILANGKKGEEQSSAIANLDKVDPFSKFDSPVDAQEWLDEDDINLLAKYVNVQYLVKGTAEKIAEKFVEESHIQLHSFLNEEWAQRMSQGVKKLDEKEDFYVTKIPSYTSGVNEAWKVRGPTHKQRYLELSQSETSDDDEVSKMLREVNTACFGSKAFQKLACFMTKVAMNSTRSTVRRLRPGLDYTMAHNGVETTDYQLDATFSFVDSSEQWAIGEVGAYDCYMVNDSEAEGVNNASAEVYRETREEDDETITLPATRNCLNLVLSNEGVMKFTKYVSANAPGSRWDIINEYEITPEDDEDEAGGIDLN